MKYIITENRLKKIEFKYLDYLFEDMYEVESEQYPDSRFWKKRDEVVLELNEKWGSLYVSYLIWDNIGDTLSLEYNQTKQLIKEWMDQRLGFEGISPSSGNFLTRGRWRHI